MVLLHGFTDSWRTWELVIPALEARHDVLALALAGHAGGPSVAGAEAPAVAGDDALSDVLADSVERAMDAAGFAAAHVVGNSLGGHLALRLAERDRALTVVALAPAGGWPPGDAAERELLAWQRGMHLQVRIAAPHADAIAATPEGRRRATEMLTSSWEHIPAALIAHQIRAAAACEAPAMIQQVLRDGWTLDPERIRCPVRIVWGAADRLLPWPDAAARYRGEWLPHADWVVLDGVGHCPQLDVPIETAQLILGFTGG